MLDAFLALHALLGAAHVAGAALPGVCATAHDIFDRKTSGFF
jgi:hypothetical protein